MTSAGRAAVLTFATLAYASFVTAAAWAVCFLADISHPAGIGPIPTLDRSGHPSTWIALPVDLALLLVFAIQHSVMARARCKRRLTTIVSAAAERSTYVLASSLALGLIFWQWHPLRTQIWDVRSQPWTSASWAMYAAGWAIAVAATFMVDHLDFLGLRQAAARPSYQPPTFSERWLYGWVRHPMMLGLLTAFWATPRLDIGHAVFAIAGTAYIAIGVQFEERDLRRDLGEVYRDYAARVPAVVPKLAQSGRSHV